MSFLTDWVPDVTHEAMIRLLQHAEKVGLPNTDECTFRALFMAAVHDLPEPPRPRFQTEWQRFDLLVQVDEEATIIEFKYYMRRRTYGLHGDPLAYKGGAGPKNEKEFNDCVKKLRTSLPPEVGDGRLVLIYDRESDRQPQYSFHRSYGHLAASADLMDVRSLTVGRLEGRVLRPSRA